MSYLVNAIGWTLLHFVWQGAVLGLAAAALLAMMRRARPEQRYTVACTALFLCLAWPCWELSTRLGGAQSAVTVLDMGALHARSAVAGPDVLLGLLDQNLALVVGLWAACAAALALRMAAGLLWIGRAARANAVNAHWQARVSRMAASFGIARPVRLRIMANIASPITTGWWRPVILLPAALATGMPPQLLEALVAHELAHVRRFDYLVNLGQNVVELLLFYHPAVWWISNRIRTERELVADDIAARHLGEPRMLAQALSELERLQFSGGHLAMAANGGKLVERIRALVRPEAQAQGWKAALPVLALVAGCLALQANAARAELAVDVPPVAQFSSCAKPLWPQASLQNEETGTVTLGFLIDQQGKVSASRLERSSGHPALDQAARVGIEKCQFRPGTRGGKPVKTWMKMQYVWTLE